MWHLNSRGSFFFFFGSKSYYTTLNTEHILKIDCSNIFLQKYFSRPQPGLLRTHGLEGASSSHVPERGVSRLGEQSPVVIISYKGYSPPKCSCNDVHKHQSHFIQFMQHYMKCSVSCMRCDLSCSQPGSQPTPSCSQLESQPTPSHLECQV